MIDESGARQPDELDDVTSNAQVHGVDGVEGADGMTGRERFPDDVSAESAHVEVIGLDEPADGSLREAVVDEAPDAPASDVRTAAVQTTEWFNVEDDFVDEPDLPALPRREHHVTAVVVSHDGAVWLPAVLTTLAAQTRLPDTAVGVDTGSQDDSPMLLEASFGPQRTVRLDESAGFGEAVRVGLERLAALDPVTSNTTILRPLRSDSVSWVWLLHDDSAPDVDCLQALLDTADDNPSAAILGPKILGWHDRRLLLEIGVTVTGAGRRITGLEKLEHDQAQHDGVRDVLSVSSAGMLVRRDVWDALGGFDPEVPLFRDDLDLCWRAHRMGERVLIATDAVLHHREASAHGRRPLDKDDLRPHRADREAAVHVLLSHATPVAAPFVAVRLLLGSAVRSAGYALGKDVQAARDEVGAVLAVALHPSRLKNSRALIANTSSEPAGVVRPLRASTSSQARAALETLGGMITTSGAAAPTSSVSALDTGPVGDDSDYLADGSSGWVRRLFLRPSTITGVILALIAILGTRWLWLGDGVLQGGALLPPPPGAGDLWEMYRQAWHDVGPGSTTAAPPYLALLSAFAWLLLGKAPVAVTVVMLLGIPIAGWSAYMSLRGLVATRVIRVWAGAAYALLPAVTGAIAGGRIGTMIAAIVLPFAIRSLVRIAGPTGTWRRAAGTAMLVAVVLAATPTLWACLVAAAIVLLVARMLSLGAAVLPIAARVAIGLLAPLVLVMPWSLDLLLHPSALLLEPGLNGAGVTDSALAPWAIPLLHPGGPGMTPVWFTAGIVLGGFLALLRRDRMQSIGALAAVGAIALLAGIAQTLVNVTPPGSDTAMRTWPGPATLLLGAAMVAMGAIAMDGLREHFAESNFTLGQPMALVASLLALGSTVLAAGWFALGQPMMLHRATSVLVPAFVAADSEGPQAPRTLMLHARDSGRVEYTLLNGPGLSLGEADVPPPADAWASLNGYVADLASGRGGSEITGLAGYGVRYVVLAAQSERDLIATLDGEPGLRRLSSSGGEVLWRVAGVTSRARLLTGSGAALQQEPLGLAEQGTVAADPYLDQVLPDGPGGRVLVTGAAAADGWKAATVAADGTQGALEPIGAPGQLDWSSSFTAPAGAASVTVWFDDSGRSKWLWLQLLVLLALVVMALPARRKADPDPDLDAEPATPGSADARPVRAEVR